jgi:hypothetical protein
MILGVGFNEPDPGNDCIKRGATGAEHLDRCLDADVAIRGYDNDPGHTSTGSSS